MPVHYCFLCASDEGVFLEVTSDNRLLFDNQLEACLSAKVNEIIGLSNKICYKCAYELDQCAKFVHKCQKPHKVFKSSTTKATILRCHLCSESVKTGHIFDITKDNRAAFTPLQKIRQIFSDSFLKKDSAFKLICLACRYNLDVLHDLKKLHEEAFTNLKNLIDKKLDYSIFPKVYTDVVNRKTTVTTFPDVTVCLSISSDSDIDENMTGKKSRVKKRIGTKSRTNAKSKIRICDECCNIVASSDDMYRFYRTGLTVCKSCWITMDPSKGKAKRLSRKNSTETKLCAVFLKDVLSEGSYKNGKVRKVDKNGEKIYALSDDNLQYEDRKSRSASPKLETHVVNDSMRQAKRQRIDASELDVDSVPLQTRKLRVNKSRTDTSEKLLETSSDIQQPSTSSSTQRGRKRKNIGSAQNSDSEVSQLISNETLDKKSDNLTKQNLSSASDAKVASKKNKKKLKSILEGVTRNRQLDICDEWSSNEGNTMIKRKKVKNMSDTLAIESKTETDELKSASVSSKETTPPSVEFKSPKSVISLEIKTEYNCDKCDKKFDTKISSAEHRLTHFKQASLKLIKIEVPSDEEKQETEEDKMHFKKAASRLDKNESSDKNADDSTEDIVNVDNKETSNLLRNQRAKNEENEEKCNIDDESGNMIDQSEKEKEEPEKSENNDIVIIEESQSQLEDTTVSDNTISSVEVKKKDIKNKNIESIDENVEALKNENDHAQETVEESNKNLDIRMDKHANTENDTEIPAIDIDRSDAECNNINNDERNDEMKCDSKRTELLVSPVAKDNREIADSLENSCKDNENGTTEDVDLPNDSQEKDAKVLEEKENVYSQVSNKTKTLSNKENSTIDEEEVENSDRFQHETDDEQNIETDVEMDKSNSAKDSINVNFDNCKQHDDAEKNDVDKYDVSITMSIDNDNEITSFKSKEMTESTSVINNSVEKSANDIVTISIDNDNEITSFKSKEMTESTSVINNSAEKSANDIDNCEMIEDNVTDKRCEMQEGLIHDTTNSSVITVNEILNEVFDLAATKVQKPEDNTSTKSFVDVEMETLENISREIRNSADMPSLDPINVMEVDDDIMLI